MWENRSNEPITHSAPDIALLVARVCVSSVFLYSGATKLLFWSSTLNELDILSYVPVQLLACLVVTVQILYGLALLLGFLFVAANVALCCFTIVATIIGHPLLAI